MCQDASGPEASADPESEDTDSTPPGNVGIPIEDDIAAASGAAVLAKDHGFEEAAHQLEVLTVQLCDGSLATMKKAVDNVH